MLNIVQLGNKYSIQDKVALISINTKSMENLKLNPLYIHYRTTALAPHMPTDVEHEFCNQKKKNHM